MKNIKYLFILLTISIATSCIDHDPNTNTYTNCTDVNYYGLRTADMSNSLGSIEIINNTTANFNTTSFNTLQSISYPLGVANNSGAYDSNTETMVFIDQWNNNNYLITYNLVTNTANAIQIVTSTSNSITAPVFLNGQLYVLEIDNLAQSMYLKEVINLLTGTLSATLLTIPLSTFGQANDTMANKVFATTNGTNTLYFLGDSLMEVTMTPFYPYSVKALPTSSRYLDLVYIETGKLVSVEHTGSLVDIVKLDISGTTITQTTQLSNIDANPESIALVYKECGDRLHVLTHMTFNNSRIHEVDILNNSIVTSNFPGFIFGIIHKN